MSACLLAAKVPRIFAWALRRCRHQRRSGRHLSKGAAKYLWATRAHISQFPSRDMGNKKFLEVARDVRITVDGGLRCLPPRRYGLLTNSRGSIRQGTLYTRHYVWLVTDASSCSDRSKWRVT